MYFPDPDHYRHWQGFRAMMDDRQIDNTDDFEPEEVTEISPAPAPSPVPAPAPTPAPDPAPAPEATPYKAKFCPYCGTPFKSETAKFCTRCGKPRK